MSTMKAAPGIPARLHIWGWKLVLNWIFECLLKWLKMEVLEMAVNRKCQYVYFKEQGLRNWLQNQIGYEQNFKCRDNLLTPPKGAAYCMVHSICLTSGLQGRGIVTPPKLDLWEKAVSCLSHSDRTFHHLGGISFLQRGHMSGRWEGEWVHAEKRGRKEQSGESRMLTEAED